MRNTFLTLLETFCLVFFLNLSITLSFRDSWCCVTILYLSNVHRHISERESLNGSLTVTEGA